MPLSEILVLALSLLALILLMLYLWRRSVLQRAQSDDPQVSDRLAAVSGARLEEGERRASLIAEAIESAVQEALAQSGDLPPASIDFGTAADGSLEIWLGEARYTRVEDIPDQRIRDAVAKAVAEFNR